MLNILSLGGLLLMAAALAGLLATNSLLSASPLVIAVQCAAVLLTLWARVTFGGRSFHAGATPTGGGLVTSGPYQFIRHPIYSAACLFGLAGAVAHWSAMAFLLGTVLCLGAICRMLCEEKLVAERYPEYREYALVTKRMVPHVF